MQHATVNGKNEYSIEWDGKSVKGKLNETEFETDILHLTARKSHWIFRNKSFNVEIVSLSSFTKQATVKVNGTVYQIALKDQYDDLLKSLGMESTANKRLKELKAPMPGMVLEILVGENDTVEKDAPLLILEAMKMENMIKSPAAGTVKRVVAIKGNAVEKNSVLIEFV